MASGRPEVTIGNEVYVPSVLGSQAVTFTHTRSEQAVGVAASYSPEEHESFICAHTRFEVLVGATDSYSFDGSHAVSVAQLRSAV